MEQYAIKFITLFLSTAFPLMLSYYQIWQQPMARSAKWRKSVLLMVFQIIYVGVVAYAWMHSFTSFLITIAMASVVLFYLLKRIGLAKIDK